MVWLGNLNQIAVKEHPDSEAFYIISQRAYENARMKQKDGPICLTIGSELEFYIDSEWKNNFMPCLALDRAQCILHPLNFDTRPCRLLNSSRCTP